MTGITPLTRQRARSLRAQMTPQERKLWAQLRDLNHRLGLNFRRQAPVGPYIADFADFSRKLVIEVDGGQHGGAADMARDAWFKAQGFTVLRFWNNDVGGNVEGAMQLVLDQLDTIQDAPPPHPSPTRGEGAATFEGVPRANKPGAPLPLVGREGVGGRPQTTRAEGPTP